MAFLGGDSLLATKQKKAKALALMGVPEKGHSFLSFRVCDLQLFVTLPSHIRGLPVDPGEDLRSFS